MTYIRRNLTPSFRGCILKFRSGRGFPASSFADLPSGANSSLSRLVDHTPADVVPPPVLQEDSSVEANSVNNSLISESDIRDEQQVECPSPIVDRSYVSNDQQDEAQDADRIGAHHRDTLIYMVAKKFIKYWGDADINDIYEAGEVLYGGAPLVSKSEVDNYEKELYDSTHPEVVYVCSGCQDVIQPPQWCSRIVCRSHTRRIATPSEPTLVTTYDLLPQLRSVLERELPSIINLHSKLHRGLRRDPEDDTTNSAHFSENMEKSAEFHARNITLQAIFAWDGFRFDTNYTGQVWPATIALMDICPKYRFSPANLLLLSFARGQAKPTQKIIELQLGRFLQSLRNQFPVFLSFQGEIYAVSLKVSYTALDNEGISLIYNFPTWQKGACMMCHGLATYEQGAYRFALLPATRRDKRWVDFHAHRGSGGFESIAPIFNSICPMDIVSLDLLHLYEEGTLKDILKDLVSGYKRKILQLLPNVLEGLEYLFGNIIMPTNFGCLRSLRKLSAFTGRDVLMHSQITVPLICLTFGSRSPLEASFVLIFVLVYLLLRMDKLSRDDLDIAASVIEKCQGIYTALFDSSTITYKLHVILCHLGEELRCRGNPLSYTTAPFEHSNYFFKHLAPSRATNEQMKMAAKRLISWGRVFSEVERNAPNSTVPGLRVLAGKIEKARTRNLLRSTRISADVRIDQRKLMRVASSRLQNTLASTFRAKLRSRGGSIEFISRIAWKHNVLATHIFWQRPAKSQCDLLAYKHPEAGRIFARIKLFAFDSSKQSLFVLIKPFPTVSAAQDLLNFLRTSTHSCSKLILENLLILPNLDMFAKVSNHFNTKLIVIPSEMISEIAVKFSYAQNEYIFAIPSRECWK